MSVGSGVQRSVFFLGEGRDRRFCMATAPDGEPRGTVLHVPAFAEELNRSRRMVALGAQALAQAGWLVLQMDLHGCGDSEGDFGEADWQSWRADLDRAADWLRPHSRGPLVLWSLRAGSLLAADWSIGRSDVSALLCWQPVFSGKQYLTQFLRIRMAGDLGHDPAARSLMSELRADLHAGRPVEVAGYMLGGAMAQALERVGMSEDMPATRRVMLFEVAPNSDEGPSPATQSYIQRMQAAGGEVWAEAVAGPKFWQSPEIETAPELIARSVQALEEVLQ